MRLTTKLFSFFILSLLAIPVFLFNACGSSTFLTGDSCGGCPNSAALDGYSITASASDISFDFGTKTPDSDIAGCLNSITFTVRDENGIPKDNICVEIFTDESGYVALVNEPGSCVDNTKYVEKYLLKRTDSYGTVTVDLAAIISAPTSSATTSSSNSVFIQAKSCNVQNTLEGTWTVDWDWGQ